MRNLIANKEYTSLIRDKRFRIMGTLVAVLLFVALAGGFISYRSLKKERQLAQAEARETWLNQGEKNPHSAAHYGSYAFRPKSELSFFDFGVDSYVGTNVYLEAHRQNDARFSAAQEASSLIRFGEMTVAFVLQLLVPLLIIFLCFDSISKEKEDNTFKLLLSQGVSPDQIAWGKIQGFSKALSWILIPSLLVAFLITLIGTEGTMTANLLLRFGLLLVFYALYFFFFIGTATVISAHTNSSKNALLSLLGIWIGICVILPKASANIGASLFKAPSNFEFREAIKKDEESGIDGHNPSDKRFAALKKEVLARYKVDSVEALPVNYNAIAMQEGEKYSSMVYNKHFSQLENTFQKQNAVSTYAALVNPYLAIRNISMGLSGSDYKTAMAFQKAAESYRFKMVETLNNHMRDFSKTGEWDKKADESLFGKIPDFRFSGPSVSEILKQNAVAILALLVWLGICIKLVANLKKLKLG